MSKLPWQTSESELVAEFLRRLERTYRSVTWTVYPETADWDLLLVRDDGVQLGIEAKLSLNAKVVDQALATVHSGKWGKYDGPDYRAVLVPAVGRQQHLSRICSVIGVSIIVLKEELYGVRHGLNLPSDWNDGWVCWGPAVRCPVPDYIPDVTAGVKSPVKLTDWKVKAIKLSIVLDRKGWVDRADMRAIGISPSRWCDPYQGFLAHAQPGQYVRCEATPDFRAQHPENYAQIEADVANWGKELDPFKTEAPAWLLSREAA